MGLIDMGLIDWWLCDENGMPLKPYDGLVIPSPNLQEYVIALPMTQPNKVLQSDGVYCTCKVFIPSAESTALVCRNCGKAPRR